MNEVSGFLLYSSYFAWKRKIESTLLPHDLTHVQFMFLITLGFLKEDGADVSQNDLSGIAGSKEERITKALPKGR